MSNQHWQNQVEHIESVMAYSLDFWSVQQEEVAVPAVAADLPDIVVALPDGAPVIRAILMFKFNAHTNTNAADNKLAGPQSIQIRDDSPSAWLDAISFVDNQFALLAVNNNY